MSLRDDLARIDAAYRATLIRRQAGVSLAVSRLFGRLTPEDILVGSSAVDTWLDQSIEISMAVRAKVFEEASDYMTDIRTAIHPGWPVPETVVDEPPTLEQIRTSLWVTGIVSARKRMEETPVAQSPSLVQQSLERNLRDPDAPQTPQSRRMLEVIESGRQANLRAEIDLSGQMAGAAAARHAGDGSRDQVVNATQRDRRVIGWVRVTSGRPCFFCAALASRGPVYQDDSFDESDARFEGAGQHKVHDHCSCSLRPVYSRSTEEWPALSQQFEDEWKALSKETNRLYNRNPTMLDWRKHYATRAAA